MKFIPFRGFQKDVCDRSHPDVPLSVTFTYSYQHLLVLVLYPYLTWSSLPVPSVMTQCRRSSMTVLLLSLLMVTLYAKKY